MTFVVTAFPTYRDPTETSVTARASTLERAITDACNKVFELGFEFATIQTIESVLED